MMRILKNFTKCWICDDSYVDDDVKVKYHCLIIGKYRNSAHREYNIKVKLNHKIPVVFYNIRNYHSDLIIQ